MKTTLVVLIFACILGASAATTEYYISTQTGNNNATGADPENPVQDLATALQIAVNASTTDDVDFIFFPGNYNGINNIGLFFEGFESLKFSVYSDSNVTGSNVVFACDGTNLLHGFNMNNTASTFFQGEGANNTAAMQINNCTAAITYINSTEAELYIENVNFGGSTNFAVNADPSAIFTALRVENCVITASSFAIVATGYTDEDDDGDDSTIQVTGCQFTNGGIQVTSFEGGIINGTSFTQGLGKTGGSLVFAVGGVWELDDIDVVDVTSSVTGSPFSFENATVNVKGSTFKTCASPNDGGCFSLRNSIANIQTSTYESCSSNENGGAFFQMGGSLSQFENVTFKQCSSAKYGGAIYYESDVEQTYFSGVVFNGNTAVLGGSAIACCSQANCAGQSNTTIVIYESDGITITNQTQNAITCSQKNTTDDNGYLSSVSTNVSPLPESPSSSGVQWWVWLILALIVLAIIIAVIAGIGYFVYQKRRAGYSTVE